MKVIFSFKHLENKHYKPLDDKFFNLAKLSVELAKRLYQVEFFGDRKSYESFDKKGITFDRVTISDKLEKIPYEMSSISKIYAMMEQTEPYILADFDTLLFQKLPNKHTVTFGYPETPGVSFKMLMQEDTSSYINYIHKFYKNPFKRFSEHLPSNFSFNLDSSPNNCLVMVNAPIIISNVFEDIFKRIDLKELRLVGPMFTEQFLLYYYLDNLGIDTGYFQEHFINKDKFSLDIFQHKFLHLMNYHIDENIDEKIEFIAKKFKVDL